MNRASSVGARAMVCPTRLGAFVLAAAGTALEPIRASEPEGAALDDGPRPEEGSGPHAHPSAAAKVNAPHPTQPMFGDVTTTAIGPTTLGPGAGLPLPGYAAGAARTQTLRRELEASSTFERWRRHARCCDPYMRSEADPRDLHPGKWWHREGDRFRCDLCPRACLLSPGQRAFCFVRQATPEGIALTSYGRSSGLCLDPIEKKPLFHFLPGTSVFSLGTAGCNLGCKFCQNWDITKARDFDLLSERALPAQIAQAAEELGARSVAYTYNDPIPFAEYALDTAVEVRKRGLFNVAVTNGYVSPGAREELFAGMDAANIDLKGFSEEFYEKICSAHLADVLATIEYVAKKTNVWLELTTLLIPGLNDSDQELERLTSWVMSTLGPDVPLHFSAFFPAYKLLDKPRTPPETLLRARDLAMNKGLKWVYVGNVHDRRAESTWCPSCGELLVERDYATLGAYAIHGGACAKCGAHVPGRFEDTPGRWGSRSARVAAAD